MKKPDDMKLIVKGKRLDGRKLDEIRPVKIEAGVLGRAIGSAYVEVGGTKVIAGVHGPRGVYPKYLEKQGRAILRVKYSMAPFSVNDRKRPGPDRRSVELSKMIKHALEPVIFFDEFPQLSIDLFVEVIQADAGTRAASIVAASVALADAGIPMRALVSSCAAGKIEGKIVLDLDGPEDNYGQADLPVAVIDGTEEISLLQLDGELNEKELKEAVQLAVSGCRVIHDKQKEALRRRYQ